MDTVILAVCTAAGYFIGNISPATLMGRLHGIDIRREGSGNPGTTNVLRTMGAKAAVCTLAIDILKGALPVIIGRFIGGYIQPEAFTAEFMGCCCGTAAFFGHIWPVRFRFKGGKGIATGLGVILAMDWRIGVIAIITAVLSTLITKRMSCGSILGVISFSAASFYLMPEFALWSVVLAIIVIWRHRSNISRLIRGQEPPLGFLSKKKK